MLPDDEIWGNAVFSEIQEQQSMPTLSAFSRTNWKITEQLTSPHDLEILRYRNQIL